MPLLLESDYLKLLERSLRFEESEPDRFFIFTQLLLPPGVYNESACDVLVVIPPNYNQDGNDMLWTYPHLRRLDGIPIPAANYPGGGDNRFWRGREFCRWSRHWNPEGKRVWRPGHDDIISIYRRVDWALNHPDAQ
jgi:hypothetical protein